MHGRHIPKLGLGLVLTGSFVAVVIGCTPAPVGSLGLVGTWTGTVTVESTLTTEGEEPNTYTSQFVMTLVIGEDGFPGGLPLFGDPNNAQLTLFEVTSPQTFSGTVDVGNEGNTAELTVTLSVTQAQFDENGFRVVYVIEYQLVGEEGSLTLSGSETYQATLTGDGKLTWGDALDMAQTVTQTGEDTQTGQLTNTVTGTLTRQ